MYCSYLNEIILNQIIVILPPEPPLPSSQALNTPLDNCADFFGLGDFIQILVFQL